MIHRRPQTPSAEFIPSTSASLGASSAEGLGASSDRAALLGLVLASLWLVTISPVQAANVCCLCKGPPDTTKPACLYLDSALLGSASDCTNLPSKAQLQSGWTCDATPLKEDGECVPVSSGKASAKCQIGPKAALETTTEEMSASALTTGAPAKAQPDLPIQLNVPIPGVDVTRVNSMAFATYIAGLYRYALSIVALAATVMFVYGAFIYLAGTPIGAKRGKEIMLDAVVGMLLVIGANLIFRTVNPAVLSLEALNITPVLGEEAHPIAPAQAGGPAGKSNSDDIAKGAQLAGGDPCAVLAFCEHESGLRFTWNGYPANPVENSKFWGPCSAGGDYLGDDTALDKKLRQQFPDIWPPLGQDLPKSSGLPLYTRLKAKADIFMSNGVVAGYLAASYAKSDVDSIIGAGIGSANITRWRTANGCKAKRLTLAQASAMPFDDVVQQACIPYAAVGNGGAGCPGSLQNCNAIDPAGLKKTKGYEISKGGQINGICTGDAGKKCFTIWSQDHIQYVLKSYLRFDAKYHCITK